MSKTAYIAAKRFGVLWWACARTCMSTCVQAVPCHSYDLSLPLTVSHTCRPWGEVARPLQFSERLRLSQHL